MTQQRLFRHIAFTFALLLLSDWGIAASPAARAADPPATSSAANPAADNNSVAAQIKALQKQVADLQSQVDRLKSPRIIAAGTANIHLGRQQDNKTSLHIKLPAAVVAQLGNNYIIQLTNRYPTSNSFFVPYWRPAPDGFDILIADPSLDGIGINPDRTVPYYVDWIIVQK